MRAVNLIPADAGGGRAGRSGSGVYLLLGVLAALVAGVSLYVLTENTVASRRAQLTTLQAQAQAAQAQAGAMKPYRDFAALEQSRVETIRLLARARFHWDRAFGDLAKVMPSNVWLTSLLGTVAPGVNVDGGSGTTTTLRGSIPAPAIEMTGCTTDHDSVVRLISRLRLIDGVQRVSLSDSTKGQTTSGGSSGGGSSGSSDCRHGHANFPQFDLVVFFGALPAVSAPSTGVAGAATAAGTPTPGTNSATPAAATTPAPSAPSPGGPAG